MTAHHIDGHHPKRQTDAATPASGKAKEATSMNDLPTGQDLGAGRYEIRVQGHLAPRWAAWFDGMSLTVQDDGTTVLHGAIADQSALHGLLRKLSDIGLPLISVTPTAPDEPTTPCVTHPDRPTKPQRSTT
jgi:hypothetical protein